MGVPCLQRLYLLRSALLDLAYAIDATIAGADGGGNS